MLSEVNFRQINTGPPRNARQSQGTRVIQYTLIRNIMFLVVCECYRIMCLIRMLLPFRRQLEMFLPWTNRQLPEFWCF